MKIAVIAWGSLIWCPGSLRIRTNWRADGPQLPIEFARISSDGRLTLVIEPRAEVQGTYWAISEFTTLKRAWRNLKERESAELADIHYVTQNDSDRTEPLSDASQSVKNWLEQRPNLGAAVWTGLPGNWSEKRGKDFTTRDAIRYIDELEETSEGATFTRAREYIEHAPPLINTRVRNTLRTRGWSDTKLPAMLFAPIPPEASAAPRHEVRICRGFTGRQWEGLRPKLDDGDSDAWDCAIAVFERRIRERFLTPIDSLVNCDSKHDVESHESDPPDCSTLPDDGDRRVVVPGFAIMALCCLLIETLQEFREGGESTAARIRSFLRRGSFESAFDKNKVANSFVDGVRNGILHEAETRRWTIRREDPLDGIVAPDSGGFTVNRTAFYDAVRKEFDQYLADLHDPPDGDLRQRFIAKMDDIAARA